jgi:hypothetical protein
LLGSASSRSIGRPARGDLMIGTPNSSSDDEAMMRRQVANEQLLLYAQASNMHLPLELAPVVRIFPRCPNHLCLLGVSKRPICRWCPGERSQPVGLDDAVKSDDDSQYTAGTAEKQNDSNNTC